MTEEKVIECIEAIISQYEKCRDEKDSDYCSYNVSIDGEDVKALKTTIEVFKNARWIPVSERLPENPGRYLAYIVNKHDDKLQYAMTCDYSVDCHRNCWFPDDECASDNVVAWMLPQPYKEERL